MFARIAKALIGGLTAAAAAYGVAVQDGQVTGSEWTTIAIAAIGAGVAVWATPNAAAVEPPK
jgi:hypothetical protein